MKLKILLFCFIIPIVASQSVEEVLLSVGDLFTQAATYKFPKNYSEFYHPDIKSAGKYGEYDFIIIGAGSSGSYLASSLSEISDWKILLLEAGQNETLYTDIPGLCGELQLTNFSWGYQSSPQETCCLGMVNNQCQSPKGKALGGSSTINFMFYSRGKAKNYDDWEKAGNPGWSYKDVLPYFKMVENASLLETVDPEYHGTEGPLHVEDVRNFGDFGQAFLDANVELGRLLGDTNGINGNRFSRVPSTTINGRRCSGNKAFLNPAIMRPNLEVVTGAFVTKLNMDTRKPNKVRVKSVEFLLGDKKYCATSRYEFILSAGAIATPQILLHSGIGPKEDLDSLGIKVVKDSAVGKNLHDHPVIVFPFNSSYIDPTYKPMPQMVSDYLNGFGYLTTGANLQSFGFMNIEDANSSAPDLELMLSPYFDVSNDALKIIVNFKDETNEDLLKGFGSKCAVYLQALLNPKSRGSIKLKSNNVFDHPLIDYKFYSNPEDLEPMVKGLKYWFSIANTEAMKRFNITIVQNRLRACPQEFLSDDYLRCYIQHVSTTSYHLGGTCKMGPNSDPEAVVGPKLKVKGVKNLRVVDCSIMPEPIGGHPNAPAIMIGAKAADMIKKAWYFTMKK